MDEDAQHRHCTRRNPCEETHALMLRAAGGVSLHRVFYRVWKACAKTNVLQTCGERNDLHSWEGSWWWQRDLQDQHCVSCSDHVSHIEARRGLDSGAGSWHIKNLPSSSIIWSKFAKRLAEEQVWVQLVLTGEKRTAPTRSKTTVLPGAGLSVVCLRWELF